MGFQDKTYTFRDCNCIVNLLKVHHTNKCICNHRLKLYVLEMKWQDLQIYPLSITCLTPHVYRECLFLWSIFCDFNSNISLYILQPGTGLKALHKLYHVIVPRLLWHYCYWCSCFRDTKNWCSRKLRSLIKVTTV